MIVGGRVENEISKTVPETIALKIGLFTNQNPLEKEESRTCPSDSKKPVITTKKPFHRKDSRNCLKKKVSPIPPQRATIKQRTSGSGGPQNEKYTAIPVPRKKGLHSTNGKEDVQERKSFIKQS